MSCKVNEGYTATAGDDWMRPGLCEAALRLGRTLAELAPGEPEVYGLGPGAGLELVDALTSEPTLQGYHLLPTVLGDILAKLGRVDEARKEFERAASLTRESVSFCLSEPEHMVAVRRRLCWIEKVVAHFAHIQRRAFRPCMSVALYHLPRNSRSCPVVGHQADARNTRNSVYYSGDFQE
jgi:hypothetical protein